MTRSKTFLPILLLLLAGILVTFTACKQAPEPVNEDLLLHVGFDEGEAFELADLTGQLPAVELFVSSCIYNYKIAVFHAGFNILFISGYT